MTLCTCIHKLPDGRIFYVGAGNKNRPHETRKRSTEWNAAALNGFSVEIVAQWNSAKEAGEHEELLIADCRNAGHPLVNKNSGGGGCIGYTHPLDSSGKAFSDEMREHLSAIGKGQLNPMYGKPSTMLGKKHTESAKAKIAASRKGQKPSEETRAKLSAARIGRVISAETRAKLSAACTGDKHPMHGRTHSKESLEKMKKGQAAYQAKRKNDVEKKEKSK